MIAADANEKFLKPAHFEKALQLNRFGPECKLLINEKDRTRVAYHESGHAVVAMLTPGARPIDMASIIPRSASLGMVTYYPDQDSQFVSRENYLAHIDVGLAG